MENGIPVRNIAGLLWSAAERNGAAAAVTERGRRVSYAELRGLCGAVAGALLDAGVRADEPVGILLERGPEAVAAYFAVLAVGAIAVIVNDTLRPRQIEHILGHSGARFLVTARDLLARQPRPLATKARIIDINQQISRRPQFTPVVRRADHAAQIIYTSGSTGLPKGVALSHGNLHAATAAVVQYLVLQPSDRIASLLPLSFVYGMGQMLCAAAAGATLVVERSPLPQQVVDTLRTERVSVLAAVPSLWLKLLDVGAFRDSTLPALRVATNAGGHLPVQAVQDLRRAQPHARVFLMYGFTEAIRSSYLSPDHVDERPSSIGRPIPGNDLEVVREDGTVAAPGEVGELVHRGPTVALGYWKDPEATARAFPRHAAFPEPHERVALSGDLGLRDVDGFFYFVGRKSRIIKTMGFRVGPDEIADVLYASGEVAEAEVVGEADADSGEHVVAHVVLSAGGSLERLGNFCRRELPRPLQPARIDVWKSLPVLSSGKHDFRALSGRGAVPE